MIHSDCILRQLSPTVMASRLFRRNVRGAVDNCSGGDRSFGHIRTAVMHCPLFVFYWDLIAPFLSFFMPLQIASFPVTLYPPEHGSLLFSQISLSALNLFSASIASRDSARFASRPPHEFSSPAHASLISLPASSKVSRPLNFLYSHYSLTWASLTSSSPAEIPATKNSASSSFAQRTLTTPLTTLASFQLSLLFSLKPHLFLSSRTTLLVHLFYRLYSRPPQSRRSHLTPHTPCHLHVFMPKRHHLRISVSRPPRIFFLPTSTLLPLFLLCVHRLLPGLLFYSTVFLRKQADILEQQFTLTHFSETFFRSVSPSCPLHFLAFARRMAVALAKQAVSALKASVMQSFYRDVIWHSPFTTGIGWLAGLH